MRAPTRKAMAMSRLRSRKKMPAPRMLSAVWKDVKRGMYSGRLATKKNMRHQTARRAMLMERSMEMGFIEIELGVQARDFWEEWLGGGGQNQFWQSRGNSISDVWRS